MKALKLTAVALAVVTSFAAQAGINIVDNEKGNFSIGGDVEINADYNNLDERADNIDLGGRILLAFEGTRKTEAGHYVAFKTQPLMDLSGNVFLDDAWFAFGAQDSWDLRLGRFEAADMFPVGLDIFLEYSGDTANDLVRDDAAYVYQMKEARGRGAEAGQIMYSQHFGNTYVEVSTMIGKRGDLFAENSKNQRLYHGQTATVNKDSFIIRPVITQTMGDFRLSAALETNLIKDSITVDGTNADVSERNGYGLTGTYQIDNLIVNANAAYLDALGEKDTTLGVNAIFHDFGLGYIYAINDYDGSVATSYKGQATVSTVYSSYVFTDVLDVPDFRISLGAYFTALSAENTLTNFKENDDLGGRVRFNYDF